MAGKSESFAEQYLKAKQKLKKETEKEIEETPDNSNIIDTIDKLKAEIKKYNNNELSDFTKVQWSTLVKDKEFTEEMMIQFQVLAQNHYRSFIETHQVSDELVRKMYYDFLGVFNLSWLKEKDRKRIFPEIKE